MKKNFKKSPLGYSDYRLYLVDFVELNKSISKSFTHRSFAKKIGWPTGYLVDVIKKRKNFTVTRAFQLSQYQSFSHLETEHLIRMVLSDEVAEPYSTYLKTNLEANNYENYRKNTVADKSLAEDIELEAVFSILRWSRKMLKSSEIAALLYTFKLSEEKIDSLIKTLLEKNIFEMKADGSLQFHIKELMFEDLAKMDSMVHIHRQYAENFLRFTQGMQTPGMYNSGFAEFHRDQFPAIAKKILELRNWLMEISVETADGPKNKINDTFVFQIDLNMFNITDKNLANKMSEESTSAEEIKI